MYSQEDILDAEGQIRPEVLDDLLIEVVSGKYLFESCDDLYASRAPNTQEQDRARILYARRLHECRLREIPTKAELQKAALASGVFDADEVAEKQRIQGLLERIQLVRAKTTSQEQKQELDSEYQNLQQRLIELERHELEIYSHCAEYIADNLRTDYLVACCTLTGEMLDQPVWTNWEAYQACENQDLVEDSRKAHLRISLGLSSTIIRALARTPEWRARWKGAKESGSPIFDGPSGSWDSNKVNLVYWSEFYDAIYTHPDAPDENTIRNDAMLRNWLNSQMAERDKYKQRRATANKTGSKAPPTYRDGKGNRKQMTRVGSDSVQVGEPYQVRV